MNYVLIKIDDDIYVFRKNYDDIYDHLIIIFFGLCLLIYALFFTV
jgi:hypothetical protein